MATDKILLSAVGLWKLITARTICAGAPCTALDVADFGGGETGAAQPTSECHKISSVISCSALQTFRSPEGIFILFTLSNYRDSSALSRVLERGVTAYTLFLILTEFVQHDRRCKYII